MSNYYKIMNLHVENIKRIKVADISPEGNVVVLEGKNKQGKTSALDSIAYAFGGTKLIPKEPVRAGEKNAIVKADIGDFTVTRKWTSPDRSTLKVESKDGMVASSPQNFLNDIIGNLAFDPLAFVTMDNKKRVEVAKSITGLDFSDLEAEYNTVFEKRRDNNREVQRLKAELESYSDVPDVEPTVRDISEIQKEYKALSAINQEIKSASESLGVKNNEISRIDGDIKNIDDEMERLRVKRESLLGERQKAYDERDFLINTASSPLNDLSKLEEEISNANLISNTIFKVQRKNALKNEYAAAAEFSENMTARIEELKAEKALRVKNTKMPIDGLEIGENDVRYEGVDFGEISQAQQIEVSMSIAIAENPKLRIVRIDNGSLLDSESMEKIKQIAEKNDYQVWIERVADEQGNAIFFEEGLIRDKKQNEADVQVKMDW